MPSTVQPGDIAQPLQIDFANGINTGLLALFAVKDGVVTELISGEVGSGSPAIINDQSGTSWKGPVAFNLSDLSFDLALSRKLSYQVYGAFNADNGSSSDEAFIDFRTATNKYLKISANAGWDKFYPRVSGAWFSASDTSLTVVDGELTTIGGTLKRRTGNSYNAELFKNGTLTSKGGYAQVSSSDDLITLTIGNNDEPVYFVAFYDDFRTLEQFNEIDLNPNQIFINTANQPTGTNYTITSVPGEQVEESAVVSMPVHSQASSVTGEQVEESVALTLAASFTVTSVPGEQVEQSTVVSIPVHSQASSVTGEQVEESVAVTLAASVTITSVPGEQVEESVAVTLSDSFTITSVPGEQIEESAAVSIPVHSQASSVTGEQVEESVAVTLSDSFIVTSVPGEQVEESTVVSMPVHSLVSSVTGEQFEESVTVTLSDSFTVTSVPGEQVEESALVSIPVHSLVSSVTGEQIEESVTVTVADSFTFTSVPGEQVEESAVVSMPLHSLVSSVTGEQLEEGLTSLLKAVKEFLLDERYLRLIKITPDFSVISNSKQYQPIKSTQQFNIKKV